MLEALTSSQKAFYESEGYLVLERRVPDVIIRAIKIEIDRFRDEAKLLTSSNDRLDLEDSHTPENPRLRRIKLPHKISDVVRNLIHSDYILAPVRDLIGPDLRLHTTKLNMKSASYGAAIEWHQDFAFYPQTNDDVLAVGVILDDMGVENGPLTVFPGTHRGPIFDHHTDGVFVGGVDLKSSGLDFKNAVTLTGPSGSLSIHHARTLHGSALNTSDRDRKLLFIEIMAADAFPVMGSMTRFDGLEDYDQQMLCGAATLEPRLESVPVRIPLPQPERAGSIYEIQSGLKARAFERINED